MGIILKYSQVNFLLSKKKVLYLDLHVFGFPIVTIDMRNPQGINIGPSIIKKVKYKQRGRFCAHLLLGG